ncbi:MAG: hypothetical protein K0U93_26485 [Gammaproteobacteria bacterium]|nr:hypothetical protein [Gammaproteobacteria bacterium]
MQDDDHTGDQIQSRGQSTDDVAGVEPVEPTTIGFVAMRRLRDGLEREGVVIDEEQWQRALDEFEHYDPVLKNRHYIVHRSPQAGRR